MDRSALLHPRGPQPASVYWRRRAGLVVVLLVALLLLLRAFSAGGSGASVSTRSRAGRPAPSPHAPSPHAPSPQAPSPHAPGPGPAGGPSAGSPWASDPSATEPAASAVPSSDTRTLRPCTASDLRIVAVAHDSDPVGGPVPVRVDVTNVGGSPCGTDLGPAGRAVVVADGGQRLWSSNDCPAGDPTHRTVRLGAGERASFSVTWDGRTSAPGCPSPGEVLHAGTYSAQPQVGAVVGTAALVVLR